jgi:hypothetical protein
MSKRAADDAARAAHPKRPRPVASRTAVHDLPPAAGSDPFVDVASNGDTPTVMHRVRPLTPSSNLAISQPAA